MTAVPKAIAAEMMTDYARDVGRMDIAAYVMPRNNGIISASLIDEVADLIAETDVDLIWPDGTRQSKLDAALAEAEQYREAARHYSALAAERTAERDQARAELAAVQQRKASRTGTAKVTITVETDDRFTFVTDEHEDEAQALANCIYRIDEQSPSDRVAWIADAVHRLMRGDARD